MKALKNQNLKAYTLFLLAQLMVAVCVVSGKFLLHTVSSGMILSLRFSVASVFLFVLSFLVRENGFREIKKTNKKDIVLIFLQGLFAGALFNGFLLWGLHHTTAAHAGVVISTLPVMVALFGIIFLRDKLKSSTIMCVFLAMIGLMIMHYRPSGHAGPSHVLGDCLILLALIPEALYYIIARIYKNKLPIFYLSAVINVINVPFCALLFFLHPGSFSGMSLTTLFALLVSGLASALFYVFWHLGSRYTRSPLVGLTTAFPPVAIMFLAAFFLHESRTLFKNSWHVCDFGCHCVSGLIEEQYRKL